MDRLTQLQNLVFDVEELFAISIDEIQRNPVAANDTVQKTQPPQDAAKLFAGLIGQRSRVINEFIDYLPCVDSTVELQQDSMAELQAKNKVMRENLEKVVADGERLLEQIQGSMREIIRDHYNVIKRKEPASTNGIPTKEQLTKEQLDANIVGVGVVDVGVGDDGRVSKRSKLD
eukprot:m.84857 g.84857  ORF g.84857 m.84857 type:complete len:174 (-) comp25817_c0_seq1:93-614(-)